MTDTTEWTDENDPTGLRRMNALCDHFDAVALRMSRDRMIDNGDGTFSFRPFRFLRKQEP